MAMMNAEKQRLYRQRCLNDGTVVRLSVMLNGNAKRALARLARHHGLSQGNMLGWLLMTAERNTVAGLEDTTKYHGGAAPGRTPVT